MWTDGSDSGSGDMREELMNMTWIQKALWLCRGASGKNHHLPQPLSMDGEERGVSGSLPVMPAEQMNNQQNKNKTKKRSPASPSSLNYPQLGLEVPPLWTGENLSKGTEGIGRGFRCGVAWRAKRGIKLFLLSFRTCDLPDCSA